MVKRVNIGIVGVQGAVLEHANIMKKLFSETNTPGEIFIIRDKNQLEKVDGLIIPGGETTTISKILVKTGLYDKILDCIKQKNIAIMGTCAGCVLLSEKISNNDKEIKCLNAMKMHVKRNAFGRQKESFEQEIKIKGFSKPYNAVFIRAPIIEKTYNNCEVLAKIKDKIIMARQDKLLAICFHPELTDDLRIHKYFLDII
ncbi:MAG: pyridoxal 5'-phosphate synthase glutaminase subunit PdxT [Candidatus Thermoplasmatota archaeon]|nr:pyridoxal 5'-phosphate synthase glutaminase subunit PdxT [Candidatus Thermoplasmatota archaeon]